MRIAAGGQEGDKGLLWKRSNLWKRKGSSSGLMQLKANVPEDLRETLCQEDTQQVAVMPLSSKDVRWALSPVTDPPESLVLTDPSKGKLHPGRMRAERRGQDEGWRWWRRCPSSVAGIGG